MPPPGWSTAQIETEQARCTRLLRGLDIVARPLPPLKEHECGAPAPVELFSVGKGPQVAFYPPVTVTCDLAATLARWVKTELQPLARKQLGADITRIDTMSSYSCRTAYGRKNAHLSEHGRANAVDLRSFTTAKGVTAVVLADWGPTGREIADQVAAARRLEAGQAAQLARHRPTPADIATGSVALHGTDAVPDWPKSTIGLGTNGGPATNSVGIRLGVPETAGTGIGFSTGSGAPSHLGGPKGGASAIETDSVSAKAGFLRAAHESACRLFGTTLGPEANAAHRNHFHVDMAERKVKSICE